MISKKTVLSTGLVFASLAVLSGCGQSNPSSAAAGHQTGTNATVQGGSGTGVKSGSTKNSSSTNSNAGDTPANLSVLYAGSMTNVMEHKIGPQADTALGVKFQGEGKGSTALAQMILSGLRSPDVFISASPSADKLLMGKSNHNLVKWYLALAQDQLVIAYSPKSRFAKQLGQAANGDTPWYQVLAQPGFRFGRTDPLLDPKGADTILMFELAETYYHKPNLVKDILQTNENPKQVFPEESLLSQLTTGQVDAIVAYKHEAVEWGVPYVSLPDAINLGNAKDAQTYASATFTGKNGKVEHGAPILFTITIPGKASNPKAAAAFVRYMVSGPGHEALMKDGFTPVSTDLAGNKADVPGSLRDLIEGSMK